MMKTYQVKNYAMPGNACLLLWEGWYKKQTVPRGDCLKSCTNFNQFGSSIKVHFTFG